MWPFRKRMPPPSTILHFKSTVAAFEFSCKYSTPAVVADMPRVALVRGKKLSRSETGSQTADIYVAGDDDFFLTEGLLLPPRAPALGIADLVLWVPQEQPPEILAICREAGDDERTAWCGFIVAKLKPEFDTTALTYGVAITYSDYW